MTFYNSMILNKFIKYIIVLYIFKKPILSFKTTIKFIDL